MHRNGYLSVNGAIVHDDERRAGAVAAVLLYGPQGGLRGTTTIDRECAFLAYREFGRALGGLATSALAALSPENLRDAARIIRAHEGESLYPSSLATMLEAAAAGYDR